VTVAHLREPPADEAAVRAALRNREGSIVFRGRFATRRGETCVLEETSSRLLVAAMEVEVAQEASIADPRSALFITGVRVAVHCRPLTGDTAVTSLSLHLSGEPDVEEVRTSSGTIHLPEVPFLSLFGALLLTEGRPELLLVPHPFEEGTLAVLVRLSSLPAYPEGSPRLLDLAAVAGWPDAKQVWQPAGSFVSVSRPDTGQPTAPEREEGYHVSGRLDDLLREGSEYRRIGLDLVAVGGKPEDAARRADPLLAGVAASRSILRRSVLTLPWEQLVAAPWFDPATGEVDLEASALAGWREDLRLPHLATTPLILMDGIYRRFLAREDVEIAQAAAILKPIAGTHVEGESLLAVGEEGAERLSVNSSASELLGRTRRELSVRKDVVGRREAERDHFVDLLDTRESDLRLTIGRDPVVAVRRTGDRAILTVWSRDHSPR
jgi:hypothetical protein